MQPDSGGLRRCSQLKHNCRDTFCRDAKTETTNQESCIGLLYGSTPRTKNLLMGLPAESTDGSGEAASSSVTAPTGSQFSNIVSKSVAGDRSHATGVGGHNAPIAG